jgi:ABC-2 type transport system permease protein
MKIYRRLSTWVMIGILVLLELGNAISKKKFSGLNEKSIWGVVNSSEALIATISVFVIVIGSGVIANEFSSGTIKLLLIRPVMRWKILLSKYISTMLFALFMLVILFVVSFLMGGILFGFGGVFQPYHASVHGILNETNFFQQLILRYAFNCVELLMLVTFAFMISTVFRNSALAIGIGVFLMFTGDFIVLIFSESSWVKYILFANLDLARYFDGMPLIEGMTLTFSIIVLAVYFLIFNIISWTTFLKRDVAV